MFSFDLDQLTKATPTQLAVAAVLAVPVFLILRIGYSSSVLSRASAPLEPEATEDALKASKPSETGKEEKKSIMQTEVEGLTREDKPFTQADLKPFDGSVSSNPIYVSIKGALHNVFLLFVALIRFFLCRLRYVGIRWECTFPQAPSSM